MSGVDEILFGRYLGFWPPCSSLVSPPACSDDREGPAKGEDRGVRGLRRGWGARKAGAFRGYSGREWEEVGRVFRTGNVVPPFIADEGSTGITSVTNGRQSEMKQRVHRRGRTGRGADGGGGRGEEGEDGTT